MSPSAIVTGASGFVGQRLVRQLQDSGWTVTACGYPPAPELLPGDVRDRTQLQAVFEQAGAVTHLFHLAAIAFVPDSIKDPGLAFDVNLTGTINLIEAMREHRPEVRLVFVSTSEIYGPPQALPVTELHPVNPQNPYAISKAAGDQYCAYLSQTTDLDIVRARPFNHSGAGQSSDFVLSNFARQIATIEAGKAEPVLHVGNLEAARDLSHVGDVIRAYERLALDGHAGKAYNICSGTAVRIQDALDMLLAMSDATIEVRPDPDRMRPNDIPEVCGSYANLQHDTGWVPEQEFSSILSELLAYWRIKLES